MTTLAERLNFLITAEDRTAAGFRSTQRNLEAVTGTLTRLSRVVGVIGGAAGFGALVAASTRTAAELGRVSDRIGIGVEDLSRFAFAAESAGVSTETLQASLQRMVQRVAEAAAGTGEAQNALRALDLNARQLAQRDPAEQFREIAAALTQVGNVGDRVRLAVKVFDDAGLQLLQFTGQLPELERQAESLNLTLSDRAARGAQAIEESFATFSRGIRTFLAEAAGALVEYAQRTAPVFGGTIPELLRLQDELQATTARINTLTLEALDLERKARLEGLRTESIPRLQDLRAEIVALTAAVPALKTQLEDLSAPAPAPERVLRDPLEEARRAAEEKAAAERLEREQATQARLLAAEQEGAAKRLDALTRLSLDQRALLEQTLTDQLRELENIAETLGPQVVEQVNLVAQQLGQRTAEQLEQLEAETRRANEQLRDAFEGGIFAAFDDGVRGMLGAWTAALARMAQQAVASRLFDLIGGAIGNAFGAGTSSGGGAGLPRFQFGGGFTVPGIGGPDSRLVAFRATPGEKIDVRPTSGGRGGGGVTVVNNVDARGGSAELLERLPALLAANRELTLRQLAERQRRGLA